ncbi:DUF5606 domain-containing protein [Aureivirga sp. CE67]|uniref:DUF5606 family protein n=1 Tax=Aureivirga sp. CE67 TaxID=1788983 RepID=UPI0018C92ADD|nr:DUF5606 domain-containing protein [Aureivirga sp. CE67]
MTLEKIISIAGKPGLYEIIAQSKGGFIVGNIVDKKRFPINAAHNVSALNDIAIYSYTEEVPLRDIFKDLSEKFDGKAAVSHKADEKEIVGLFREILPEYDEDRVYVSNIRKVIQWYNLLAKAGLDFTAIANEEEVETEEAASEEN